MTGILLKIIIFAVVAWFVYTNVRRLWRDLTGQFRADDKAKKDRVQQERQRPDVIDLKRDADGVYRPPDER